MSASGGLIRDSLGQWKGGFVCNLGISTALLAEIWGLYYSIRLAWRIGLRKVIIETDSLTVIKLIRSTGIGVHKHYWLIEKCKNLLKQKWEVKVVHTLREGNRAADWLANFAGTFPLGHHECDGLPAGLRDILQADMSNIGIVRRRSS